eukprot:77903_1
MKHNSKMKRIQSQIDAKRVQWLKHHYFAFEPFLTDNKKRRLRPKELNEQPETLEHGVLRDCQLYSVNWMRALRHNGVSAILADEMGVGKTIQSIATIAAFLEDHPYSGRDSQ